MISVLLPYRDAETTLAEAMESVLADLAADDELLAIDDGSRDASAGVVHAVAARDRRVVPLATLGTPARAAGIVAALTRGLRAARGALIGRMDADDVSMPGRFAAERELLAREPALAAVAVQIEAFPAPAPGMQAYVAWQNAQLTRRDHACAIFVEAPLCHPSTLLRRAALDAVGGYRDVAWPEDYDLWLRLDAAGFGLAKVPRVLFRWRVRGDSLTFAAPRNARTQLLAARASFLARRLEELARPFAIWGAGQTGRRLARALEGHGVRPRSFVDIDPRKIGRAARGVPILDAAEAMASAARGEVLLVVAVGDRGARDVVRARLAAAHLVEGEGFVCAA